MFTYWLTHPFLYDDILLLSTFNKHIETVISNVQTCLSGNSLYRDNRNINIFMYVQRIASCQLRIWLCQYPRYSRCVNSLKVPGFLWAYALLAREPPPVAGTQELVLCWPREGSNSLASSLSTHALPSVQQGKHTRLNYRQMPMHWQAGSICIWAWS